MSTELKSLKGQFHNESTDTMENTEMSLTRFSGGNEGMKVQLTLSTNNQSKFFTHITLNNEEIKTLIKELQNNFEL